MLTVIVSACVKDTWRGKMATSQGVTKDHEVDNHVHNYEKTVRSDDAEVKHQNSIGLLKYCKKAWTVWWSLRNHQRAQYWTNWARDNKEKKEELACKQGRSQWSIRKKLRMAPAPKAWFK
eukprot:12501543-Ditylum_brightwellii.AAC.1